MEFLEHLAQAVERTGHAVTRGDSFFVVEPINVRIEAELGDRVQHNVNGGQSIVFNISIKAAHELLFPEGIRDCLAGLGGSDDEAFAYAAQSWTEGVFLTIHRLFVPEDAEDFQPPDDMLTRNQETGEEFGWKVYDGALQAGGEFATRTDLDETILQQKMLSAISSVTIEKRLFWIKIYIAKFAGNQIQGDCWLNNQDWIDGMNAIYWFAEEWGEIESYAALKQFIILKPCEVSEIANADKIRQNLPPLEKPGFFKRLFGR